MDIQKIKELIELVEQSSVSELKISDDEGYIKIVKDSLSVKKSPQMVVERENSDVIDTQDIHKDLLLFKQKSPLVGTFYRAPIPDSNPFINIGDSVQEGDVLCIVESMKVMNRISAETSGVIKEILVENGQMVEFDQTLFIIE